MTVLQITCDNCGAKYKLPDTFAGSQAKCQKCGSVIDVQKQRAAAAAPSAPSQPAAKPAAAARPAVDRSKEAPKAAERASSTKHSARAERGGKEAGAGGEDKKRSRPEREAKKSSSMPLLLSAVGVVAIGVVAFLMFRGKDEKPAETPNKTEQAKGNTPTPTPAETPAAKAPAPTNEPTPKAPETAKVPAVEPEKPAATPKEASAPTTPATPDDPTRPKKPWEKMRNPPATMADVADAKNYGEVKWPDSIDEAKKTEIRGLAADAASDGIRSVRAKTKLVEVGYGAMFGIVEQLQKIDYKSAEQSMVAFDLNKLLDQITGGLNARFEPVDASEEIVPAKAEWNTRSVKGWIEMLAGIPDEAAFQKARAERLKKQAADK